MTIPPRARPVDFLGLASWAVPERVRPVEHIHHQVPDSPSRLARKPKGGTGRACVDDDRRGPRVGFVLARGRWGGPLSASAGRPAPTSLDGPLSPVVSAPRGEQSMQASQPSGCPHRRPPRRCRSAVRAIGRQCRSGEKRLLPPGRYDRSTAARHNG